jgi:hypothetical protein
MQHPALLLLAEHLTYVAAHEFARPPSMDIIVYATHFNSARYVAVGSTFMSVGPVSHPATVVIRR